MISTVTFTRLDHIPGSSNIMLNPERGFFKWNGQNVAPVKSMDSYARYNWSMLETSCNIYNFNPISSAAAAASNNGGKFSFGVRCLVEGTSNAMPGYLSSNMPLKWWSNIKNCCVPDWNDAYFLKRVDALASNLGANFNNDPRIDYVEIRTYGNWGEWHVSGFETPSNGASNLFDSSTNSIIDSFVKWFPNKQVIMMSDNDHGLAYSMGKNNAIGWRRDSWGHSIMENITSKVAWSSTSNRWTTAPVIVESIGTANGGMNSNITVAQIQNYNVSRIGNGNFWSTSNWADIPVGLQTCILDSAASAGYIYGVSSIQFPSTWSVTGNNTIQSSWYNIGNAPTYHSWQLKYRLLSGSNIAWTGISSLSLKSLLPGNVSVTDLFTFSGGVTAGSYVFDFIVVDTEKYYQPMNIAISNSKNGNGGYTIATIVVK